MKSASAKFPGFPPEALKFFAGLRKNNNRDWFEAHKEQYLEHVKAPMEQFTAEVMAALVRFAPAYAGDPRKAIFRLYRDTRFSHDKTPYKDHTGALLHRRDLPKNEAAGFYFGISDRIIEVAGGCYMPGPDQLRLLRSHIAANAPRFARLVKGRALTNALGELKGERLTRPPKGYLPDTPGVEFIQGKQWYFYVELDAKLALSPGILNEVVSRFKAAGPFVEFLNEPLLAAVKRNAPLTTGW